MCYFLTKSKLSPPKFHNEQNIKVLHRDFPGGPVVGTSPSNAERASSLPGGGNKMLHALRPEKTKNKNGSNIVTNSVKTLKMVHIKKTFKEKS